MLISKADINKRWHFTSKFHLIWEWRGLTLRNLCFLDATNKIFLGWSFIWTAILNMTQPGKHPLSEIQVTWKPSLFSLRNLLKKALNTERKKKKSKIPKAGRNVSCFPRQAKFRRCDLLARPCCSSCQVKLKSHWPGNIMHLLFSWCLLVPAALWLTGFSF